MLLSSFDDHISRNLAISVVDPNSLNFDPDPGYVSNYRINFEAKIEK